MTIFQIPILQLHWYRCLQSFRVLPQKVCSFIFYYLDNKPCSWNLDSDLIDLAISNHISTDSGKKDVLDNAIVQALPELFKEGSSHDNQTQNFVWALEKNLSAANVKLITKRDNDNFNELCSVGIFIYIDETCYCSEGFIIKTKRYNIISDDEPPFSESCPRTVTRVCYHGKCYCEQHQSIPTKRDAKKFKGISGGGGNTAESSASAVVVSWYNNLKLCYYLFVVLMVLFS